MEVATKNVGAKDNDYCIEVDGSGNKARNESATSIPNVNIKYENIPGSPEESAPKVEIKSENVDEVDSEFEAKDNDIDIGDFLEVNTHTDESNDGEDSHINTNSEPESYGTGNNDLISVEITEVINGEVQLFRYKVRPVGSSNESSSQPDPGNVGQYSGYNKSAAAAGNPKRGRNISGALKNTRRKQHFEQILDGEEGQDQDDVLDSKTVKKKGYSKRKSSTPKRNVSSLSNQTRNRVDSSSRQMSGASTDLDPLSIDPLNLSSSSSSSGFNQPVNVINCNNNNDDNNNVGDNGDRSDDDDDESLQVVPISTDASGTVEGIDKSTTEVVPISLGGNSQHSDSGVMILKKVKPPKKSAQKEDSNSRPVYKRDKKVHICNICSKAFTRKSSLNNHINIHNPLREKPFTCNICGKSISCLSYLKTHQASHTNPWKCDMCGKNFKFKSYLSVHMRHHFNDRPYMCDLCGKAFTAATCLKKHIRIHTGISPYQCTICQKYFAQKVCLDIHMANHTGFKPYLCDMCGKSFPLSSYLLRHIRTEHQTSSSPPPETKRRKRVRSLKRLVKCQYCKLTFKDRLQLQQHEIDYHDA